MLAQLHTSRKGALSEEAPKLINGKGTFLVPTYATVIDLVEPGAPAAKSALTCEWQPISMQLHRMPQPEKVTLIVRLSEGKRPSSTR